MRPVLLNVTLIRSDASDPTLPAREVGLIRQTLESIYVGGRGEISKSPLIQSVDIQQHRIESSIETSAIRLDSPQSAADSFFLRFFRYHRLEFQSPLSGQVAVSDWFDPSPLFKRLLFDLQRFRRRRQRRRRRHRKRITCG